MRSNKEQIIIAVNEAEAGPEPVEPRRQRDIPKTTYENQKEKFGNVTPSDAQRPKEPEQETCRLERPLAESMLDNPALNSLLTRKEQAHKRNARRLKYQGPSAR